MSSDVVDICQVLKPCFFSKITANPLPFTSSEKECQIHDKTLKTHLLIDVQADDNIWPQATKSSRKGAASRIQLIQELGLHCHETQSPADTA